MCTCYSDNSCVSENCFYSRGWFLEWSLQSPSLDLPLPCGLAPSETMVSDHGLGPPLSTENPRNKGFSGPGAPIFGFGLGDPATKGQGQTPVCSLQEISRKFSVGFPEWFCIFSWKSYGMRVADLFCKNALRPAPVRNFLAQRKNNNMRKLQQCGLQHMENAGKLKLSCTERLLHLLLRCHLMEAFFVPRFVAGPSP